jgi:hypothetical protein
MKKSFNLLPLKLKHFFNVVYLFLVFSVGNLYSQTAIFNPSMSITPYGNVDSPMDEEYWNIIDGQTNTKFLDYNELDGMGFTVNLGGTAAIASSISITTANDFSGRDPRNYEVLGSDDGSNFTSIATGVIQCISTRFHTRNYYFVNTTAYKYYRINFTNTCSDDMMQLAEVQLYTCGPAIGGAVTANQSISGQISTTPDGEANLNSGNFAQVSPGIIDYEFDFFMPGHTAAQSFKTSSNVTLSAIKIDVANVFYGGSYLLRIFEGEGDSGTELMTQGISINNTGINTFNLNTPLALTGNQSYTFKIESNDADATFDWTSSSDSDYARGSGYSDGNINNHDFNFQLVYLSNVNWQSVTLTGFTGGVQKWQKDTDINFSSPIDIESTSSTLEPYLVGDLFQTTYFRAVVIGCTTVYSNYVTVSVVNITAAPTASEQTFCAGKTVDDLVATGTDLKWYDVVTGGTALATSTALATGTYFVSQTVSGTESERTSVAVTVNTPSTSSQTVSQCGPYTWAVNGQNYTQSGTYSAVLQNAVGCDSTITLNLTIKDATSSSETVSNCGPYTWAVNGQNYTQSGTYTAVLQNAAGCDSTITLNLTIKNATSSSETVSHCGAYTWAVNGLNYTQSGTYTAILTNAAGCDSTITLNLTINELPIASVSTSSPTTVCQGTLVPLNANTGDGLIYVWRKNNTIINGATNTTYSVINSGFYEVEVTHSNGCKKSSAKTNVTVNPIPSAGSISGRNYVCKGTSIKLTPTVAGGVWSVLKPNLASIDQNGNITGLMKTNQFITEVVAYTVTNIHGCSSSVKRGLGIDSLPVVPIIAGPDKFCSNGTVLYRCTNLGSVSWTAGTLLTASSFYKGVFTHRVAQNGAIPFDNFASSITATSYSTNKVCTSSSTKNIQLRKIASKAFVITAPTNLTVDVPVSVSASSTNLTTLNTSNRFWISSYNLDLSVTATSGLNTTIQALRISTEVPKLYFNAIETSTGCGLTAYKKFTVTAASSLVDATSTQTTSVNGVHLYPNPSNGKFTIENTDGATSVKLVDLSGRVIAMQPIVTGIATVDFTGIATGKYMVHISGKNFNEVQPIVIE